ncbi:hypothetical protein PF005_g10600 [Phytophthora fragariae]|uniref:Secreted protein n=1 Tax=Phytophthora fragariae TaxID=53985 RepID=A0A6A3KWG4_9STRA|nr:hypothetical protein PF003_g25911 [Phytophthora fragariae]KAE8938287.1 hypothetical protein PF009_g11823 [Phytophthora fragariae]KAE9011260.1 hypothetical protein PF011_g9442 [Phytophthora fragariae]KAE9113258.1 hypothetical protein PF007_g10788 [Phytophthora fragariae]KAE9113615.1 hypothetical protein PF010_g10014 [Phytophthora fragariae]
MGGRSIFVPPLSILFTVIIDADCRLLHPRDSDSKQAPSPPRRQPPPCHSLSFMKSEECCHAGRHYTIL